VILVDANLLVYAHVSTFAQHKAAHAWLDDRPETQANKTNLVADSHLVALAIEHGLTLYSVDGDFARFPGLRWENPLS